MNHFLKPRTLLLGSIALFAFISLVQAEDIYVAQAALGTNSGASAANAHSKVWFETSSNWSSPTKVAGKIGPGDTVHLVGTIDSLGVQASGTAGNPITILFESGAKLSSTNSDLLYIANRSYLTIDGGTNGILENTANGTLLANKTVVKAINASGISNVTIKNLTIKNLYVHTSIADGSIDFTTGGGVYANGYGAGVVIQNCAFSDMCWCIIMFGSNGGNLTVTKCSFVNYDHGIGGVACQNSGTLSGFTATYNHFGATANWDTTANTYHHDGIHTFWGTGSGGIPNAVITNNLFDGNWGINNTAHLFFEQNYNTHAPSEASGWLIANNIHVQYSGNYLNNGFMVAIGNNAIIANNTYIGASISLSQALSVTGTGCSFKNNLIYGVNRFIDAASAFATGGLSNNIYAAAVGSGNTPFRYQSTNVTSFAAWKTATGQDAVSSQLSSMTLNSDGSLPSGNPAIDAGTSMAAYFTTDYTGATRSGTWDIGAYESGSSNQTIPPSGATTSITAQ